MRVESTRVGGGLDIEHSYGESGGNDVGKTAGLDTVSKALMDRWYIKDSLT
jgi:hypothetical protein